MELKPVEILAFAKVNLLLDVLGKRPDGYHELEGIMQSVSICDVIVLYPSQEISVFSDVPLPTRNTCRTAAEAFLEGSGFGVRIEVRKRIPSEAGLGGASADAAAVLRGLNEMFRGTPLEKSEEELMRIGLSVGADVPFCLLGGCAIARGVGEKLTPVPGLSLDLLIVRGPRGVSTGKLFSSLGVGPVSQSRLKKDALENALTALENGDKAELASQVENALQGPACGLAPEIDEYVKRMLGAGALGACMTGSGAAVFGIFESREKAISALPLFSDCDFAQVCRTLDESASRPLRPRDVVFRKGTAGDAELTARLRLSAWETTYRGIYPDEAFTGYDMAERAERDRARFLSPGFTGFIIEASGEACGYLFIEEREAPYIMALYLLEGFRGLGIGRRAIDLVREYCRERGHSRFTCNCNSHNFPALAFYGRMGGREIARDVGHENPQEDQVTIEFDV